jgi:predicted TIM-barrel fold metal-dependent hydrolase
MTTTSAESVATRTGLGYALYDADQHYYEAVDTWTRHLSRAHRNAARWAVIDGRQRLLVGDHLFTMNPDPTFATVGPPGVFEQYFRGNNQAGLELKDLLGQPQPTRPEYTDREARLAVLDAQGVAATLLLPTAGLGMEEMLNDRPGDLYALLEAVNRWLEDDWGYAYQDRLFPPALLSLADPELAVRELCRVRDAGARLIVLRPGPVVNGEHSWSPGNPRFDRFWATAAEAGVIVAYHAADSGYEWLARKWGEGSFSGIKTSPLPEIMQLHVERPIQDTLAALIGHGVFDRHPTLRVVTVELGSTWVLDLVKRMRTAYGKIPQQFGRDPVESFREHVWITPFYEDDLVGLSDAVGVDRILLGSDWPHPEGLRRPIDFLADLQALPEADHKRVLSDNLRDLLGI